ncbi:hypothetical protein [Sphingorhabdus sp. Alg231-15]|uniref:hypothetical protein n=1 Tax=Sphingorhabdus sp. Alg231-15 TaxID=1922222 RepID=UPI00307CA3F1
MHLLNSIDGAIEHVLLFVPEHEAQIFSAVYSALINSLPSKTSVSLLVQTGAEVGIDYWDIPDNQRERMIILDAGDAAMTSWACDLFLAGAKSDEQKMLLATPSIERREDNRLPALLAEHGSTPIEYAAEPFEAGNFLISENHIFVGADSAVIAELEQDGREIVTIDAPDCPAEERRSVHHGDEKWQEVFHYHNKPETRQPIFHIDMFMTPAGPGSDGRERILVGDPAMAAQILHDPLHPLALAERFDTIAADLKARGFDAIRNPLPMIYMDNVDEQMRIWFYASSNNLLVQCSDVEGNIVWMPEYGHDNWPELTKTDEANREIWTNLGYEVRMIPDGQRLAENLGGLHCLTNVLKRG